MRILTWNINGIRTFKGRIKNALDSLDADIICVQETKVTRDLLEAGTAIVDGYNSYFSFSRGRSGYSGVATYCKDSATPFAAEEGLSGVLAGHGGAAACYGDQSDFCRDELQLLDNEGRAMITQHKVMCGTKEETLTVINVYCPRADPEKPERKQFKLQFYKLLQCRAEALLKDGSYVIVLGDVNTSHRTIDHCDPADIEDFNDNPGRKWLNGFLGGAGGGEDADEEETEVTLAHHGGGGGKFVDTFRHFHPTRTNAFTCWSTLTGARHTNYGTRIDYIFADRRLVSEHLVAADIMPEVEGSDHCPVWGQLSCLCLPSSKPPPLCTCYLPEFAGKQQKLSRFLVRVEQTAVWPERGDVLPGSQEEEEKRENLNPAVERGPTVNKRPSTSVSLAPKGKKAKAGKTSPNSQGSLLSFFKPKLANVFPSHDTPEQAPQLDQVKIGPQDATTTEDEFSTACRGHVGDGSPQLATNCRVESQERHVEPDNLEPSVGTAAAKKGASSVFWKSVLRGPPPPPSCKVHREPCVLRTVKKEGPNMGKQFFVCCRPQGHASNPDARCNFFAWVDKGK